MDGFVNNPDPNPPFPPFFSGLGLRMGAAPCSRTGPDGPNGSISTPLQGQWLQQGPQHPSVLQPTSPSVHISRIHYTLCLFPHRSVRSQCVQCISRSSTTL